MGETEESKRLQSSLKTPTGAFSEIVALSQGAINKALGNLMTTYPGLAQVDANLPGVGSLKGTAAQPMVSLKVAGADRAHAEYFCNFSSGTLQFELEEKDRPDLIDISKWTIAFDVKIGQIDLDENTQDGLEEAKKVRDAIQQPGDFSINTLYLEFNGGDIIRFNIDNSDFNGVELSQDQVIYLGAILSKWYIDGEVADRKKSTFAYGLKTGDPKSVNQQAPTFPPTALKFQTYEYIAPGHTQPEEGISKGNNNMLLYLQMTDHKSFPQEGFLMYSGNYVSPGMSGTICINRNIFWNSYLLRYSAPMLLPILNAYTYAWIKSTDLNDLFGGAYWEIGIGDPGHHASDPSFYEWKANPENPLEWTFIPSNTVEQHFHKRQGLDDGYNELTIDCTTNNTLTAELGSNVVHASGKTDITINGDSAAWFFPTGFGYKFKMHGYLTWDTTMTLNPNEDGGLNISLNLPDDMSKVFYTHWEELDFSGSAGMTQLTNAKDKYQELQNYVANQIRNIRLGDAEVALQNDLANSARFVVPGADTFVYQNSVFNNNADLMIEIDYRS